MSFSSPTFAPLFVPLQLLPFALRIASPAAWRKLMDLLPFQVIKNCLAITDAMDRTSKEILARKKELLAQGDEAFEKQVGEGKDIMSVLCTYIRNHVDYTIDLYFPDSEGQYARISGGQDVRRRTARSYIVSRSCLNLIGILMI